jgi:16S rRNA (cytosine967-C5)-methyltransferase
LEATVVALEAVLDLARPADAILAAYFRSRPKLGNRDRAFIAEAVYGVLRHLRTLEHLGAGHEAPRRLLLAWLARYGGHNLREFENLISAEELAWLKTVKATDLARLPAAMRLELPDWLHERLRARYGDELEALVRALNHAAPLDLRVNPLLTNRDEVLAALARDGIAATSTPRSPVGLRLKGKPALNCHPLFLAGRIEVQDEGSQLLAYLVAPRRGEMVCDFCAGAGGKTLTLGSMMHNTGRLYAFDVSEKRLAKLRPRLKRSGLSNVYPQRITSESDTHIKRLSGKMDRVLVDAPCSGLGTLRRNPDLKWRQTPESVAELTLKQASILRAASRLVKPGGRLVYATCSLLPEENEEQVAAFLHDRSDFHTVSAQTVLAGQHIVLECGNFFRVDPLHHGCDGFFAAILERDE